MLIVDDSAFMRKVISDFIAKDARLEVAGTARNGTDAVEKAARLEPDVITMDVEMPGMDGLEALDLIMREKPTPVVMLSSTTFEGAQNAIKAMELGAVDFVAKTSGPISLDLHTVQQELTDKVYTAAGANMNAFTSAVSTSPAITGSKEKTAQASVSKQARGNLVLIGTSTGGPRALQEVLKNLPASLPAPILVVQHMPPGFTKSLAGRLDALSAITVKEAEEGEILRAGTVYIAPGGYHMTVKAVGRSLAVMLDQSEPVNGHRPSVDRLFQSVSRLSGIWVTAVVLTGMGSDGTEGICSLKEDQYTYILAESEETAIVYGMPKTAVNTGKVDKIAPLGEIAGEIAKRYKDRE